MTEWLVAISSTIALAVAFSYFRLFNAAQQLHGSIIKSYFLIRNNQLSDNDKECQLQDLSIVLFKQLFQLTGKLFACFMLASMLLVIVNLTGIADINAVFSLMFSAPFLLASIIIFLLTTFLTIKP